MATVFLAEDLKHHRSVAIKVLHSELAAALGAERFLREIEIAARLQHPHILPLYDSGAASGLLFYVMPYVEGESLRDRLDREKQLSLEDTLRITAEVAGALAYAHSHGVVHRDIKPENIMLSGGTAVVADFGIARALSAAGEAHHITQTGTVIGTPAYMSPEQATGSVEIDGRSDEYSLAAACSRASRSWWRSRDGECWRGYGDARGPAASRRAGSIRVASPSCTSRTSPPREVSRISRTA